MKLTEEDVIRLFNILRTLNTKFRSTKYESVVRSIASNLFNSLKLMPGYNRISKPKDLFHLVESPFIDAERE